MQAQFHQTLHSRFAHAALSPGGWSEALDSVVDVLGGKFALLVDFEHRAASGLGQLATDSSLDPARVPIGDAANASVLGLWNQTSVFPAAASVPLRASIDTRRIARTPFYEDWLAPNGLAPELGFVSSFDAIASASEFRSGWAMYLRETPSSAEREMAFALFQSLSPVVSDAVAISRLRRTNLTEHSSTTDPLVGLAILDAELELLWNDRAFDAALRGGAIDVHRGRLICATSAATQALRRTVAAALTGCDRLVARPLVVPPAVLHAARPSYRLIALRLDPLADIHGAPPALGGRVAILTRAVSDRELQLVSTLQSPFGLTASEAQVSLLRAQGLTVREIAAQRHTSNQTVRNQLQCVHRKLHVRSVAGLALRIAAIEQLVG